MRKGMDIELKVGLFVTVGLALILIAIIVLGSTENLLVRKNHYRVHFNNVEGLLPGAKVVMGGIQVGTVDGVSFDRQTRDVLVELNVAKDHTDFVRQDSVAEIATQGVLGDKYLSLTAGSPDEPQIAQNGEIHAHSGEGLTQFISKGDRLMMSLNDIAASLDRLLKGFEAKGRSETFFNGMAITAKNLSQASDKLNRELDGVRLRSASQNLNDILEKINNGTGTLGALINDPGLYDDAKALMGGANRNRIIRNLVRQTIKKGEEPQTQAQPQPEQTH